MYCDQDLNPGYCANDSLYNEWNPNSRQGAILEAHLPSSVLRCLTAQIQIKTTRHLLAKLNERKEIEPIMSAQIKQAPHNNNVHHHYYHPEHLSL